MKSYVKIYGPPVLRAVKNLEKMAIDIPEVCIMSKELEVKIEDSSFTDDKKMEYFSGPGQQYAPSGSMKIQNVARERCHKMISESGEKVGEYDFYFEWFEKPSTAQLNSLIERIDEALTPLGCKYTITTR